MAISTAGMSREQLRELRKKLKEDLATLQSLNSKLEAREIQLKQSQPTHLQENNALFSGNDLKNVNPRVVKNKMTLQLNTSFRVTDSFLSGAEPLSNKRTPKANQLYSNTDFVVGKEKMPPLGKSKSKSANGKRGLQTGNGGDRKRKQVGIPTEIRLQCKSLLNKLMSHKDGWVFNHPVDAVKLGLSDYHLVITKPMDLGTIRSKLDRKQYSTALEFAEDVRLTFNNAKRYNPQTNDVHIMAIELSTIFEKGWEVINEKILKLESEKELLTPKSQVPDAYHASSGMEGFLDQPKSSTKKQNGCTPRTPRTPTQKPNTKGSKKEMTVEEKTELGKNLNQLPQPMIQRLINLMKERNINMCEKGNEVEIDMDSLDNNTLWDLYSRAKNYLKSVQKSKMLAEQKAQKKAKAALENNVKAEQEKGVPSCSISSSSGSSSSDSESSTSDSGSSSSSESDADD